MVFILNPQKGILFTAAAGMQRRALFLRGHRYKIEFKRTNRHSNADRLSRLPLESENTKPAKDDTPLDVFTLSPLESLPITAEMILRETKRPYSISAVIHNAYCLEYTTEVCLLSTINGVMN